MKANDAKNNENWAVTIRTGIRAVSLTGYALIALFLGGFGIWAAGVPLAGAVIVPGVVEAAGNNNEIQHLEGGIISKVHVSEGERVASGAPLVTLDDTAKRAELNMHIKRWIGLLARQARLESQRDKSAAMVFDDSLLVLADRHKLQHLLDEQAHEFRARLSRYQSEEVILRQRVAAARQSIAGYESQRLALEEQKALIIEEIERKRTLLDKGLAKRSEYTALLRSQASLVGQIGSLVSETEQAQSRIVEAEEQLVRVDIERVEQALSELSNMSTEIGRLEEQIVAAWHVLERLVVTAPADGLIVHLPHTSPGSVVGAGAVLAELLPTSSELIVETRLDPEDIDAVRVGQDAQLRLVALNTRMTPQVEATVVFVSPDRLQDKATGREYFAARLSITDDLPVELASGQIYPGMSAEVLIATEKRTFLEYLVKPITDSFHRAFRER
ncbi:HlyD family type I secretion periplasmic adaptor subunit [Hoeflea prorocentri]|uniref:Membrane fusion protein (MFP) family protein n=1 Tax=Hoeflea prorocentri TaxID=1922333 RepID=A0A9X3UJ35_9HYPH|nr:HlyD family type I secretion periplasmic adaptor subunit [Hoeflea prorocentri]MCY6379626.1 HlyD family type I secretion periplasmic adaptor subunit [Hoeflea prorocentri]MDA5397426.1 HlyD family type I secretion periplasmic adaptor subunit [Hoeflea prorocentri]